MNINASDSTSWSGLFWTCLALPGNLSRILLLIIRDEFGVGRRAGCSKVGVHGKCDCFVYFDGTWIKNSFTSFHHFL